MDVFLDQPETLKGWFIYIYMCVYMGYQPKNGQHLQCRNSTLSISFWKLWDLSHHYNYRRLASCEGMFTIQELRQLLPHRPVAFGARRASQFQHMWHVGLKPTMGLPFIAGWFIMKKIHENGWFRGNPIVGKLHFFHRLRSWNLLGARMATSRHQPSWGDANENPVMFGNSTSKVAKIEG